MLLKTDPEVKDLLEKAKTVAVVGWSPKPDRPSHEVAAALKTAGFEIYPVNPTVKEDGVYASLADVPVKIDVVDVFRRAEDVPEVVEEAIRVGAKAVWIQLGIVNEAAATRAAESGLDVVMDKCMKVEVMRLLGK